jgi:sigma-B regulation protein RsbU (phosphoserine phosphatase)
MPDRVLLVIADTDETPHGRLVEAALSSWPVRLRPQVQYATIDQVLDDAHRLDLCAVAWVMTRAEHDEPLFDLLALLQDRHLCGLVTREGEMRSAGDVLHEALMVAPPDAEASVIAAMLRTLWTAGGMMRALKAELKLVQLHHGGLMDQIGKMDEELRLAAQLQREFLPHVLPSVHNLDFRVFFRPAGYVSGDIYDVFKLDEEHVGFYVADAVGHGVPAALMTMFIKRSLPTKEIDTTLPGGYRIVPPGEALRRLNVDMTHHQNGKVRFATACYGVLNWRTLELTFARAGHPFPYLLRAGGNVEELNPDGSLLGVFAEEQFEQSVTMLAPGDRLLLYSDGFELAFREKGESTADNRKLISDRYTSEFRDLARGTLDEAMHRLTHKIDHGAGSLNQTDDLTAIVIGVRADLDSVAPPLAA